MNDRIKPRTVCGIPVFDDATDEALRKHPDDLKRLLDETDESRHPILARVWGAVKADRAANKPLGALIDGDVVGWPDPDELALKRQPGQPLGSTIPDAVVEQYLPQVKRWLRHFGVGRDKDAFHAAVMGVCDALDRYDPTKDIGIGPYAEGYIKGALADHLAATPSRVMSMRRAELGQALTSPSSSTGAMTLKSARCTICCRPIRYRCCIPISA